MVRSLSDNVKTATTLKRRSRLVAHDKVDALPPDQGDGALTIAEIPDMEYYDTYVSRRFGAMLDLDVLAKAHALGHNVLLEGPTGPGKTSFALAYAAKHQMPFYPIPSNVGVEPSQLFGKFIRVEDGSWVWFDGGVTAIVRDGGVLLINEINFLAERIATVLFGLLDKRREVILLDHKGERVRAHRPPQVAGARPCWCSDGAKCPPERAVLVAADMNPDYEGTRPLNRALRNRFALQIEWGYDRLVEEKLVKSRVLLDLAYKMRGEGTYETPISTNMLQEFEAFVDAFGVEFAIANFTQHFSTDERSSVAEVFRIAHEKLVDDLVPANKVDDGFGGVFRSENAKWSTPVRRGK